MSFSFANKNQRRSIGIIFALFITGFMTFGFLQSYQHTKLRQVKKINLVEVAIFADKPAAEPILYEVVPTEECIKKISVNILSAAPVLSPMASSNSVQASSAGLTLVTDALAASAANTSSLSRKAAAKVAAVVPVVKKKPTLREPVLIPAKFPKCIAKSFTPEGFEKLGSEGFIGLALNLAKTGRIERGEVEVSSGFPELDIAALKQVTDGWQFEPCKKQNKVVACKQHIRFRWQVK